MASKNQTTSAYQDCYRIMEQAIKVGGLRVEFPDKARATVFRHRCYKGRALLYRASKATVPVGVIPSTQFDDIVIRFESDVSPIGKDNVLIYQLRSRQELPLITDLDGNPIQPDEPLPNFTDLKLDGIILDD